MRRFLALLLVPVTLGFGGISLARSGLSDEPSDDEITPALPRDPSLARILRRAERPRATPRATQGVYMPPVDVAFEPEPPGECEAGQRRACPGPWIHVSGPIMMRCVEMADGSRRFDRSDCATPLVVAFDDAPVRFTQPPGSFTVGPFPRTDWVSPETPWLVLDGDGSGCVEGQAELFGPDEHAANGFEKLARLDADHDGKLDVADPAFARLALWYDRDEDRRCSAREMVPLAEAGVVAIDLGWWTPATVAPGSHEGERAALRFLDEKGAERRGRVVDVYLAPL